MSVLQSIRDFFVADPEVIGGYANAKGIAVDWDDFHRKAEACAKVMDELDAQDRRWGQQDHPFVSDWFQQAGAVRGYFFKEAEEEKVSNDIRAREGTLDWRGILLKEVYEALAEDDPQRAIVELVQVAAVAVQAAMSIERNGLGGRQ